MRRKLARHQADRDNIAYELKAVNHHRTVLRDATEQLERSVKNQADTIADLEFQVERLQGRTCSRSGAAAAAAGLDTSFASGDWANTSMEGAAGAQRDSSGEEALLRQVNRYKARAAAMEELSVTYRVSVLALYSDGSSYGAAQFGWQPYDETSSSSNNRRIHHYHHNASDTNGGDEHSSPFVGLVVAWIEREMTAVKHCNEDEIRLLDSEVSDLRVQLRQSRSFTAELRRRY